MKKLTPVSTSLLLGLGLLVGATSASADPSVQLTTPQNQTATLGDLIGSDTLEDISRAVIAAAPAISADAAGSNGRGIAAYLGLGSSAGQRQLIGNPGTGEPTCQASGGTVNGDSNWGCAEVAPMSRQFNSAICTHDADDPRDPDDSTTANSTAEGLAVCLDGLSIVTDNASHRQYADNAGACVAPGGDLVWDPVSDNANDANGNPTVPGTNGYGATGKLRNTSVVLNGTYNLGANGVPVWKDVLRLVYTGCSNTDGTCATRAPRATRCSATGNPVRAALVNSYSNIFEGVDCPEGNHCSQLRAAYRRDDASGTTGFFLEALGLAQGSSDLANRTRMALLAASDKTTFQSAPNNIFCDGGDKEGLWPDAYSNAPPSTGPGSTAVVTDVINGLATIGDPLQRTCAREDDLCGPSGTIGLVRPIRSPRDFGYPPAQCARNQFDRVPGWLNTAGTPTCADGRPPVAGTCWAPYVVINGVKSYDCLNPANSRPSDAVAQLDGRVFNFVWRLSTGELSDINHNNGNNVALPEVAQWRQNASTVNPGAAAINGGVFGSSTALQTQTYDPSGSLTATINKTYTGGTVCQQGSSTALIGCITANTRCTIGWGGREIALLSAFDDKEEAVQLPGNLGGYAAPGNPDIVKDNYPISRSLFVNAIGGFENIDEDCAARSPIDGSRAEFCTDQMEFARRFYAMGSATQNACLANGFIPVVPDAQPATCGTDATCAADMAKRWTARCVGSLTAETGVVPAGCGRVNTGSVTLSSGKVLPHQPANRCDPDAAVSPEDSGGGMCTDYSPNSGSGPTCG